MDHNSDFLTQHVEDSQVVSSLLGNPKINSGPGIERVGIVLLEYHRGWQTTVIRPVDIHEHNVQVTNAASMHERKGPQAK